MKIEEANQALWEGLLDWLTSDDAISPEIRELFLERAKDLRLKMQTVFIEIQKKFLNEMILDAELEGSMRRQLRREYPYMSALDKKNTLQVLQATLEARILRLEAQLAGFDFFNNIETAITTLDTTKISVEISDNVRALPSNRRQALLTVLTNIVTEINKDDTEPINTEPSKTE